MRDTWDNPQAVDRLQVLVADVTKPYSEIYLILNAEFGMSLTRNSVIGKAGRMGFEVTDEKKHNMVARNNRSPARKLKRRAVAKRAPAKATPVWQDAVSIDDAAIPIEQRKTFMELTSTTCRWPVGEVGHPDFFFCGGKAIDRQPYCPGHARKSQN